MIVNYFNFELSLMIVFLFRFNSGKERSGQIFTIEYSAHSR